MASRKMSRNWRPLHHANKEKRKKKHALFSQWQKEHEKSSQPSVTQKVEEEEISDAEEHKTAYEKLISSLSNDYQDLSRNKYKSDSESDDEDDDDSEDVDDDGDTLDGSLSDGEEGSVDGLHSDLDDENVDESTEDMEATSVGEDTLGAAPEGKGKKRKRLESDHEDKHSEDEITGDVEDPESDSDIEDNMGKEKDPYTIHLEKELPESFYDTVPHPSKWKKKVVKVAGVGKAHFSFPDESLARVVDSNISKLQQHYVKQRLCSGLREKNVRICQADLKKKESLTPLQQGLFAVMNNYQDLYYTDYTHHKWNEVRFVYCLHILNHVLKSRSRVVAHDTKKRTKEREAAEKAKEKQMKSKKKKKKKKQDEADFDDQPELEEYRDQGFFRPKVLVLLPTCESAYHVICTLTTLLRHDKLVISGRKRFKKEFHEEEDGIYRKGLKPEDYEAIFAGNNNDYFRIGLGIAKKSLRLYAKFYAADVIVASPLGLRQIIKAEGEKDRDFDFLSSIELLVVDQADTILMQNWDHVLHIFDHLHLTPVDSRDTDLTRVRLWALQGRSQYHRQTVILSSINSPEIASLFTSHCHNHAGKVQCVRQVEDGTICQIGITLPQYFYRMETQFETLADDRFKFFIDEILPKFRGPLMARTLIFIPSYFDFVRVRNYFTAQELSFVQISENSSSGGITRARFDFFHGKAHFMLYTERLHFNRRFKIRGARHLILYELPHFPHFYSELCNMLGEQRTDGAVDSQTCTVLYSRFEAPLLAEVVGLQRASRLLKASSAQQCLVTGKD